MHKKTGSGFASPSPSALDGRDLAAGLQELLWDYLDRMRPNDASDTRDLAAYLLYCSYVSRNADGLGLDGFDQDYAIDEAPRNVGNKYLAADFIGYYAGSSARNAALPNLRGIGFRTHDLSKAITTWASALEASSLSLMEDSGHTAASSVRAALAKVMTAGIWDAEASRLSSLPPISELVARIADVEGKDVLDFACGNGMYLATALAHGARSASGRDANGRAVARANIMCFFADPLHAHDLRVENALTAALSAPPVQRVLVAPPLGVVLGDLDRADFNHCGSTLDAIVGEDLPRPRYFEDFCIAKALASLDDDGVAVLHVSASFLFHQHRGRKALRRALVEGGRLLTVIELPGGCVPGTGVKSALLVLSKEPSDAGVLLVDLDSRRLAGKGCVIKDRGKSEITEDGIEWIAGIVERREEIPLISTIAKREAIVECDSNLCYSAHGDLYNLEPALDRTRITADIMGDIQAAQAAIDELNPQIAEMLQAIEDSSPAKEPSGEAAEIGSAKPHMHAQKESERAKEAE